MAFWEDKTLQELTPQEWEQLCDGCARCCLVKLENVETEELFFTNVHCRLLDRQACRCTQYPDRSSLVPDCIPLTQNNVDQLSWMPSTCAYRLRAQGKALPDWHPLVSGSRHTVHAAGISIRSYAVSESEVQPTELTQHVLDWLK